MMNISDKNLYLSLAISGLLFLLVPETQASEFGDYWNNTNTHHLAQQNDDGRQLELTAGQSRSRVKSTLVNFILGRTVNKYLSFGTEDNTGRKNAGRLKLRLNRHRAMFVYRYTFY